VDGHDRNRDLERERRHLIDEITEEVRATEAWLGKAELAPRVLEAVASVPRHEFVPSDAIERAYQNHPLPIGFGQTISQPYVVAVMTDLLELEPDHVVLEVGTGSGYQAAVLSRLCRRVYSIERVPELAESAARRLARLGYLNVEVRSGDGSRGWPENAPFERLLVTAAGEQIPPALLEQLARGGRLVLPLGPAGAQELVVVERHSDGSLERRSLLPVAFVPLMCDDGPME
jgi:protein-L-isoaspartate(D-aspartate) O-methyltransferase